MGQIPAICRTFTGRTHDLTFLRQNMLESAGIYRPNDRPKGNGNRFNKWEADLTLIQE